MIVGGMHPVSLCLSLTVATLAMMTKMTTAYVLTPVRKSRQCSPGGYHQPLGRCEVFPSLRLSPSSRSSPWMATSSATTEKGDQAPFFVGNSNNETESSSSMSSDQVNVMQQAARQTLQDMRVAIEWGLQNFGIKPKTIYTDADRAKDLELLEQLLENVKYLEQELDDQALQTKDLVETDQVLLNLQRDYARQVEQMETRLKARTIAVDSTNTELESWQDLYKLQAKELDEARSELQDNRQQRQALQLEIVSVKESYERQLANVQQRLQRENEHLMADVRQEQAHRLRLAEQIRLHERSAHERKIESVTAEGRKTIHALQEKYKAQITQLDKKLVLDGMLSGTSHQEESREGRASPYLSTLTHELRSPLVFSVQSGRAEWATMGKRSPYTRLWLIASFCWCVASFEPRSLLASRLPVRLTHILRESAMDEKEGEQKGLEKTLVLPIFPLRKVVRLPTEELILNLYEDRYLAMAEYILKPNAGAQIFGALSLPTSHKSSKVAQALSCRSYLRVTWELCSWLKILKKA